MTTVQSATKADVIPIPAVIGGPRNARPPPLAGDMVTASGSGLDPHITLENARYQLDRVADKWAADLQRDLAEVRKQIENMIAAHTAAPFDGLVGERFVNVLEVNLDLRQKFGEPRS